MVGYLPFSLFTAVVSQGGKPDGVSFPFHDCFYYRSPGLAVYVRNRVMYTNIHLIKAFLHLLDRLDTHNRQSIFLS
jgi:hypothetical protein